MPTLTNYGDQPPECPPLDSYVLRLVNASDVEMRPAYGADRNDPNCRKEPNIQLTWKIAEFVYDPDEDERDWNGFEVKQWYTISRNLNNEKSKLGQTLKALMKLETLPEGLQIDMEEYYSERIKATVGPNKNGWPRVDSPLAYKPKRAKKPQPVYDEDEDDPFEDDAA